jgi:hypothetical protein
VFRIPRPLATTLLASAAATVLLTACGDDSDDSDGAAGSSSGSSSGSATAGASSSGGGDGDTSAFCSEAQGVFAQISSAFDAAEGEGVDAAVPLLDDAVDAFDDLEPPAAIEEDWQTLRDGFADLRDAVSDIDPDAPDARDRGQAAVDEVEGDIGPSLTSLDSWFGENCTGATPAG